MSSKAAKNAKVKARAERASELLAAAERKRRAETLRRGAIVGGLVAVVIAVTVVLNLLNSDDPIVVPAAGDSDYGLVVGDLAAPHEIVVYEDFLCPVCQVFEEAGGEQLVAAAEAGSVVLDFRPISILSRFGPYSEASLNAFFVVQEAAGDEVAKEFHDLLYADQPSEQGPFPDDDWLVAKAVEAGADETDVRPGIEEGAGMDDAEAATAEAVDNNVTGTPTVLLDGVVFDEGGNWEERADLLLEAVS